MNLVLDIGNTLVKLAVFDDKEIVHSAVFSSLTDNHLNEVVRNFQIAGAIASSVRGDQETLKLLKKHNLMILSHQTPLPLTNAYDTPKTLGLDRLAAVIGANRLYAKDEEAVLVIDMGTCITYDICDEKTTYLGGGISPGIHMRLKALNHFTGSLPLINQSSEAVQLVGKSTEKAILSGVYWGVQHELEGIISQYESQYPRLKIVLTGGDANRFDLVTKNRIFADEFLVLRGLNEIVKYNEKI